MEVSEAISVQAKPSELGFHQPPPSNNGDSDHETSDHCHGEESGGAEIGLPQPRASSNGDSNCVTGELALAEQIASLDLKESGDSPKSDAEVKRGVKSEEIVILSESDNGDESVEEEREDLIEKGLGEEKKEEEESIGKDLGGEEIGNEETVDDENEGVKEIEVINGGDELEKKDERFNAKRYQYPVRPEAEDCAYYLKTGNCKFGGHCKFNHPARKKPNHQAAKERIKEKEKEKENEKEREELPERSGRSECKFYSKLGGCKYGKACKYYHPRVKSTPSIAPVVELNFLGLPIRTGEKECTYYMQTGSCKYGVHCRYNHPDPTDAAVGSDTSTRYSNGVSQSNMPPSWLSPRPMNEVAPAHTPFVTTMTPPTQRVLSPNSEWNEYQAPAYLPPERNMPPLPTYSVNNMGTENQVDDYPERPGQPDCSYFLKTGDCKYRSNCKYHHPKIKGSTITPYTLSDKGLPIRPDQLMCIHYSRYGICKFGPACKYDHSQVKPTMAVSEGDNQHTYGHSVSMEGDGMTRSGSRSDVTIQQ